MKEVKVVKATVDMKVYDLGLTLDREEINVASFMEKLDRFLFNDPIQRGTVWSIEQKAEFIVSILNGYPVPDVTAEIVRVKRGCVMQKKNNITDGKQRMTTVRDFKNNKITLPEGTFVISFDEEGKLFFTDLSGLTYEQLPQSFKNKIDQFTFIVKKFEIPEEFDEETRAMIKKQIFARLNNGSALNNAEKRKSYMDYDTLKWIAEQKVKACFQVGLTDKQKEREQEGEAVQQAALIVSTNGDTGLDGKLLDQFVQNGFTDDIKQQVSDIADYLSKVANEVDEKGHRHVFNKTKVTSMFAIGNIAIINNISPDSFAEWAEKYFWKNYKESSFKQYANNNSASSGAVTKRIALMTENFCEYFNLSPIVDLNVQNINTEVVPV